MTVPIPTTHEAEKEIAAIMALAEFYARAYYRWYGAEGSYESMVDAKANLYDHLAKALSMGVFRESPHASPPMLAWKRLED